MDHVKILEKGLSLVPLRYGHMAKVPAIEGWQLVEVTEEKLDYWAETFPGCGWGLLLGEKSSGICCVDIDTDDPEMNDRILNYLDVPTFCAKRGAKGFTFFFRLLDGIKPEHKLIHSFKIRGHQKPVVEVFLGNKQTVMPPSAHPDGGFYHWLGENLFEADLDEAPLLSYDKVLGLDTVVNSASLAEARKVLPKSADASGAGRWSTITSRAGQLLATGMDESKIVHELIELDRKVFFGNQFFLSREKLGQDFTGGTDVENCITWIANFRSNVLRKDRNLVTKMANKAELTPISDAKAWMNPLPFSERELMLYGSDFPLDILPDYLQAYFKDYSERMAVTPDGMVLSMITGMGALLQGKVYIYPKGFMDDFMVRPNLFSMIVAPSGMKKDAMASAGLKFYNEIEADIRSQTDYDMIRKSEEKMIGIYKKRRKAIEDNDTELVDMLDIELRATQKEALEYRKTKPELRFQNGTVEKLFEIVSRNQNRGLLIHQSEFTGLVATMKKAGNETLRAFLLKLANGTDPEGFQHQTITGLNVNILRAYGSLLTACQSDALNHLLRPVKTGSIENDGFYQRFLYCFPRELNGSRQKVNKENKDYSLIGNKFWLAYNLAEDLQVDMTDDAIELFIDFEHWMIDQRRSSAIDSALQSLQAKYMGTLPKIAYILQFLDSKPGEAPRRITKDYIQKAVTFMEWQKSTIECFWFNSSVSLRYQIAATLSDEFSSRVHGSCISLDALKRKIPHIPISDLNFALKILEEKHHIRLESQGASYLIRVNPKWVE